MPNSDPTRWFTAELAPHESALRAYLHGLVPPSDINDIVQETYARILRAFERGPIESPRGLLLPLRATSPAISFGGAPRPTRFR